MKAVYLFFAVAVIVGCHEKAQVTLLDDSDIFTFILRGDTLIILDKAAIFYAPDSARLEQIKKTLGNDTFHIAFDDYAEAANEADKYLRSTKILTVEIHNRKYFQFEGTKDTTLIRLDTLRDYWGLYFFAPNKKPKLIDEFDIEKEYREYFK